MIKEIRDQAFHGERALFKERDAMVIDSTFGDALSESSVKECRNVTLKNCEFTSLYPCWHNAGLRVEDSYFAETVRAGFWYSKDVTLTHTVIDGPKNLRDCSGVRIADSKITREETLWQCKNVDVKNTEFQGDYFFLHSENVQLDGVKLDGKYALQYSKDIVARNCVFNTKDIFWNSENITVYDSVIEGKYLAWYAKNITLINCKIIGTQPLCYVKNLKMIDCEMVDTDLCFEYSTVDVSLTSGIDSIKNPISGQVTAAYIDEVIFDDPEMDEEKTVISLLADRDEKGA